MLNESTIKAIQNYLKEHREYADYFSFDDCDRITFYDPDTVMLLQPSDETLEKIFSCAELDDI